MGIKLLDQLIQIYIKAILCSVMSQDSPEIFEQNSPIIENNKKENIPVLAYKRTNLKNISELPTIKGSSYQNLNSLKTLGFEASNLYRAYEIWSKAIDEDYKVVLAFTSNAVSCGLRDLIALLCKNNLAHCVITTGGGIEEDIIKTKEPAKLDLKPLEDGILYDAGVNRTQNMYFCNTGYVFFEEFMKKLYKKDQTLKNVTVKQLIKAISGEIDSEDSYLYWCNRNNIMVLAGGLEDCAIGDYLAIQNYGSELDPHRALVLNCARTLSDYLGFLFQDDRKILTIILGGGFVKHMAMNGCIARGGADSAIYLNDEPFYTGSNCGAPPAEAVSWGKLKHSGLSKSVKVHGDYVLPFYLLASQIINDRLKSLQT